jgi:ankyrin repeat protein
VVNTSLEHELFRALYRSDFTKIKYLSKRAERRFLQQQFYLALEDGREVAVKALVQSGKIDIHAGDRFGFTPVYRAAWNGHATILQYLLERGAKANISAKGTHVTPLIAATMNGHLGCVKILHKYHASMHKEDVLNQWTAFAWACSKELMHIAEYLYNIGAHKDIDTKDVRGMTPLAYACSKKHMWAIYYLIVRGAQLDIEDEFHRTPLHWAVAAKLPLYALGVLC